MLSATTYSGDVVTLALLPKRRIEELRKNKNFYCPECKESVIVRAGPKVIPHFAHKNSSNCSAHTGGEGIYHQQGKLLLYDWLIKQNIPTRLEAYIPQINQRPDLLIRLKKRFIAIEFQCASIPTPIIQTRNEGYKRMNIVPIWILGGNQFKRNSNVHLTINSFTLQFIHQFSSTLPTALFYFCPKRKKFSLISDLILTTANRALVNFTFKSINENTFMDFFPKRRFSNKQLFRLWQLEKRKFRLKSSRVYGTELSWRKWLYEKKIHLQHLPSIVHLPIRSQYRMTVPTWNWQSRFIIDFLDPLQIGENFSFKQAIQFLQRFQVEHQPVQLAVGEPNPILEYLAYLHKLNIISPSSSSHYKKTKPIQFYQHIEQSVKGDDELLKAFMYNHK